MVDYSAILGMRGSRPDPQYLHAVPHEFVGQLMVTCAYSGAVKVAQMLRFYGAAYLPVPGCLTSEGVDADAHLHTTEERGLLWAPAGVHPGALDRGNA